MTREQKMVEEFRRAVELPVGDLKRPEIRNAKLHAALLAEELAELIEAVLPGDVAAKARQFANYCADVASGDIDAAVDGELNLVEAADGLADIQVLTLGAACDWGIDLGPVFDEVNQTNMAKAGGPRRADGKLCKPPGWKPPNIRAVLERQVYWEVAEHEARGE